MAGNRRRKTSTAARDGVAIDITRDQWPQLAARFRWTQREGQIAQLLFEEHLEKQIARTLKIKESTLHTHVYRIYEKMKVHSRASFSHAIFKVFLEVTRSRDESPRRRF